MSEREREVLAAVDRIVDDFGNHRRDAYFSGFADDATFVMHTHPVRLESRAEYEAAWGTWERDGFQVLGCRSTGRRVQFAGDDVAIFTHDVETELADGDSRTTVRERETIVMQRRDGSWTCIHEHLSPREEG
ncbi:nuclear transport factor 2 family protein [Leifsonia sp. L25]|uniref:nuclear transport factor 2 family protein n=1 Tax=Actinomycetes TaxID=1760 RepID=UPI003D68ED90